MFERKSIGAVILTVATLLLFIGLWCIYLSPPVIYGPSDLNIAWYRSFREQHFPPNATKIFPFNAEDDQYVRIYIENVEVVTSRSFDVLIYDPENNIVYQRTSASTIDLIPRKTGEYTLEIHNQPYVETELTVEIIGYYAVFKPLIPTGQLLILTSIPLYGLSIWLIAKRTHRNVNQTSIRRH